MITMEQASKEVIYCPMNGIFCWARPRRGRRNKSNIGSFNTKGYRRVNILNQHYYLHRLAWFMYYGTEPDMIDHIDGNPSNNAIWNLRAANFKVNGRNTKRQSNNTSGQTGVHYDKKRNSYYAQIIVDGDRIYLGNRPTFNEACVLRKEAECEYGFHKNHGRN